MHVYPGCQQARGHVDGCALVIGNFDGVHLGHQTLLHAAAAAHQQGPLTVLTFDPHPASVLMPELAPPMIMPLSRRLQALQRHGVQAVVVEPFTSALAGASAEDFVDQVLLDSLRPALVVVGHDFTYGARRQGDTLTLSARLQEAGVEARVLAPHCVQGLRASSTKVREFVLRGQMRGCTLLLGRPLSIWGQVVHGAHRGASLGVRTLNLDVENELVPQRGVYATWAVLPDQAGPLPSVTNIGRNPTFGDEALHIESHVLAEIGDQYGQVIELQFVARLRDERRFESSSQLVEQIQRDILSARQELTSDGGPKQADCQGSSQS